MKKKDQLTREALDDSDWARIKKAKEHGLAVSLIPNIKGEPTRGIVGKIGTTHDFIEIGDGERYRLLDPGDFRRAKVVSTNNLLAEIMHLNQENKELRQILHRSR